MSVTAPTSGTPGLNAEGRAAVALSTLSVRLDAEARVETVNLVTGAALSRHQIYLHVAGENANAVVNGAALLGAANSRIRPCSPTTRRWAASAARCSRR